MPKRCNPFGDNSSPQLKTHVREKQVDSGVCQQTRMQAVYDRTHQLLFAGMKEMQVRHESLDVNENCLPHSEVVKADKSDFKQMHLNKSCQLVDYESGTLMDMETDSNSCHDSMVHQPPTQNMDTLFSLPDVVGACVTDSSSKVLPSFGSSFGRSPCEYSPVCVQSSLSSQSSSPSYLAPVSDVSSSSAASNALSCMKQAQFKKAACEGSNGMQRACQNCRQPVKPQDVTRCQFCEKSVCCVCSRQCAGCLLCFCQLCSVVNYDLPAERAFCLNCQDR